MAETSLYHMDKKTWNKWSLFINVVLFIIVAVVCIFLIKDSYDAGSVTGVAAAQAMLLVTRDAVILAICLTVIFIQLFRYQRIIIRRNL